MIIMPYIKEVQEQMKKKELLNSLGNELTDSEFAMGTDDIAIAIGFTDAWHLHEDKKIVEKNIKEYGLFNGYR